MLLPTKIDLNKARAQETKRQIDEGLSLAKRVDAMRVLRIEQETNIKKWKDETVKAVQGEINQIIERREEVKQEISELLFIREELKKPLTEEWDKVNKEKEVLADDRYKFLSEKTDFEKKVKEVESLKLKTIKSLEKLAIKEQSISKTEKEVKELKDLANVEYNKNREIKENNEYIFANKLKEMNERIEEYKVAKNVFEIREQEFKDKEVEFTNNQILLKDRIGQLERTIKRNGK